MEASMQHRPQERSFGMVMKEVDKDLALFLEMRNRENAKGDLFFNEKLDGVDDLTEIKCKEILTDDVEDGRDFNWLLTGPVTTLCLPLDVERPTSLEDRNEKPNSPALTSHSCVRTLSKRHRAQRTTLSEDSASLKSKSMQPTKPANIKSSSDGNRRPTSSGGIRSEDSASLKSKSLQPAKPANIKSSSDGNRRPTLSGGIRPMSSRPATPTGRPSLPVMSNPSRSSTPNSRATGPSLKTLAPAMRSSTPTRVIARSSTPTARSFVPSSSKSVSRSATPTPSARSSTLSTAKSKSRSATPTSTTTSSTPSITKTSSRSVTPTYKNNSTLSAPSSQSSSVAKMEPTILKTSAPSRGASPTVKPRPSKQSEMPSFPCGATNLSTSATKRPNSASRVRPSAANSCSSLKEASSTGKSRQQSCSPSRVRPSNANACRTGPAMLSKSFGYGSMGDDVNPVLIGTQMVERVVNMRKLAPSKQADHHSDTISSKKSSTSQENSGFGRSLSKKSLDMAIRHMDLTRSMAGDNRLSKVSTSASPFNVRNGVARSKTTPVSNSQFSTSSNDSSEPNLIADSHGQTGRPIDNCDTNSNRISFPIDFQEDP